MIAPVASRLLVAALLALGCGSTWSQSSIPNPLVRPPQPGALPSPALGNAGSSPKVTPVPRPEGASGESRMAAMPMPELNKASLKDELGPFTITAIVGDVAVLRTNVGSGSQVGQQGQGSQSAGGQSTTSNRQQVMRVRNGVSLTIAGTTVVPTVHVSSVEFRERGHGGMSYTVHLDSNAATSLPPIAREAIDPAVAARAAPAAVGSGNGNASGGSFAGGSSGSGTPQATQR
jgi:hypothetical protein